MKKLICLAMAFAMIFACVTVSAEGLGEQYVIDESLADHYVTFDCSTSVYEDAIVVEKGAKMEFSAALSDLNIIDRDNDSTIYFDWTYGAVSDEESGILVEYGEGFREDGEFPISMETEGSGIDFIDYGATVTFDRAGRYLIEAPIGFVSAEERMNVLGNVGVFDWFETEEQEKVYNEFVEKQVFYVTVKDENGNIPEARKDEPVDDIRKDPFGGELIDISGILSTENEMEIKGAYVGEYALCQGPVVITTKKAGINMFIDEVYFEDNSLKYGDFYEAEEYDNYSGNIELPENATISIREPGIYSVLAQIDDGEEIEPEIYEYTGLIIEVVDKLDAIYTNSKVMVDGEEVKFEAYNIQDNNYFKLRDIACVLSGTARQFEVSWDEKEAMVAIIPDAPYTKVGGELVPGDGITKAAQRGARNITYAQEPVELKAYNINGNNYFKLRDLGELIGFNVSWDGENNCVLIDSTMDYQAE